MEPFRFTAQAITFAVLIAVVAAIVALAAPFGSIALGTAALLALGAVLIKAMFRTRRWWPLTAVEGTVAVSCLVLVLGALGVVGYSIVRLGEGWHMTVGWPHVDPTRAGERTRAVSYSDPVRQQKLKDALREAGIPFSVKMEDGKEFVGWAGKHDARAEAINQQVGGMRSTRGRGAHIPDAELQDQFRAWLAGRGVKYEVEPRDGKDWIIWDDGAGDLVREFMESRSSDCKERVAAGKGGAAC